MRRRRVSEAVGPLAVLLAFIGLWYLLAYRLHNNFNDNGTVNFVPPPHKLFQGVPDVFPDMLRAMWLTTRTAMVGLLIAIVVGTALAVVMSQARWLERSLWPFLVALQAIPILAVVPLLASVFRSSSTPPRLITVILVALFPIVSNTLFGLQSVDEPHRDLFRLHRAGRFTRLVKLELPAASPAIFTGFRISAGLAVIGSIVADFFFTRGDPGLGRLIQQYFFDNQPSRMFVASMLASLVGISFFLVFGWLGRRIVGPWLPGSFGAR
ncbi:MAG: transporter permease [Acidimicrobiia bacterium]|nr:transporter permease [Acidimicrobiia bacterium]